MKKFLRIVILLLAVAAVWGLTQLYNQSMENIDAIVDEKMANLIIVPEKPEAAEGNFAAVVLPESTEGTYPWETEFHAENYKAIMWDQPDAKCIEWSDPNTGVVYRQLNQSPETGRICDNYYYPSGSPGLVYEYYADGSYHECRRLDGGENYYGQIIYTREIDADGSIYEYHWNKDGQQTYCYYQTADSETERHWLGGADADHNYLIYNRVVNKDGSIMEEHYNSDGYYTYQYHKSADYEIELIGDETGKLIECTDTGVVIDDPARLARYAEIFGFRE